MNTNEIPRRNRMDQWTPAEKAIHDAVQAVEAAGAHPSLTDAVILLGQAREAVADFVDRPGPFNNPALNHVYAECTRAPESKGLDLPDPETLERMEAAAGAMRFYLRIERDRPMDAEIAKHYAHRAFSFLVRRLRAGSEGKGGTA